tara:strand:- start:730 stop:1776 length:1047 start_codon:yes stop_codon:yes gene_type:complete
MHSILITGGAGFVGSHTVLNLLEIGYKVFVLDSFINSSKKSFNRLKKLIKIKNPDLLDNLEIFEGDIKNISSLKYIFKYAKNKKFSIDSVMHFAGLKSIIESTQFPLEYWSVNVLGTINLLNVMEENNCTNFVFSSSAGIYGNAKSFPINEESLIEPINPYGNTKATVENLLKDIYLSSPKRWHIATLRYFNPIGAHPSGIIGEENDLNASNILPLIINVAKGKEKALKIYGDDWETPDGTCIRDYIHVMDVAEGHILCLDYLLKNDSQLISLNLGTGSGTSVLKLIKTFESVNKVKIPYAFFPKRIGEAPIYVADSYKAKLVLNWEPKRDLKAMCRDAWNWEKSKVE